MPAKGTQGKVLNVLLGKSRPQRARGSSMAEICREINVKPMLWCGKRLCGFPNPRKRKTMTLFRTSCSPKYSTVMGSIRTLAKKGEVTITTEMKYDTIKRALDPRRMVRLSKRRRLI